MENNKSVVILLSRQHLRPSLNDEWVRKLKEAAAFIKSRGWTLYSSVGSTNWDLMTAAAIIENVSIKLFLPVFDSGEFDGVKRHAINEFDLKSSSVQFEAVLPDKIDSNKEELWQYRDRVVLESSDILMPISLRPNGIMSGLLRRAKQTNQRVIDDFQVAYDGSSSKLSYSIDQQPAAKSIKKIGRRFVIHWTRTCHGPWPNEKKIGYYRSVLNSTEYPRTAFHTLERIINEKKIIPSSKNMPGKTPTVSFSGLAPIDSVKLMKWRARYHQMSFEPYGIGIEKETAQSMGIVEVQYYDPKLRKNTLYQPKWLTQSVGKITDWRNEEEFRYKGNFDLKDAPLDKLMAVCYLRDEAVELENKTGIKTVWFCD